MTFTDSSLIVEKKGKNYMEVISNFQRIVYVQSQCLGPTEKRATIIYLAINSVSEQNFRKTGNMQTAIA